SGSRKWCRDSKRPSASRDRCGRHSCERLEWTPRPSRWTAMRARPAFAIATLATSCWVGGEAPPDPKAPSPHRVLVGAKRLNGSFPASRKCDHEQALGGTPFPCGTVERWTLGATTIAVDTMVGHWYRPYFVSIERGGRVWLTDRLFVLVDDDAHKRQPI